MVIMTETILLEVSIVGNLKSNIGSEYAEILEVNKRKEKREEFEFRGVKKNISEVEFEIRNYQSRQKREKMRIVNEREKVLF